MTTKIDQLMEPEVRSDPDRGRVAFDLRWGQTVRMIAGAEPTTSEECDVLLLWVERMEAALDNFTSAVRLVQSRMLDADAIREAAAARGERGAGAEYGMEVDRG